jgi:beta-fructofuranosidase
MTPEPKTAPHAGVNIDPPVGAQVLRPRFHHTAPTGWINDPLGLTFHEGRYHLFTQHVPGSLAWDAGCHWAHATSADLMHWAPQPLALSPGEGDDGVWSGCIIESGQEPARLLYTSVDRSDITIGRIRVARPDDASWTRWTKGPVVAELPPGVQATAYRDPWVVHDGDRWRMLVGGGLTDGTAVAWSYSSDDLNTWTFDGEAARRPSSETSPLWTGTVWECPQLFQMDGRWVLLVSVWEPWTPHYVAYSVGDYTAGRFTPRSWKRLSFGPSYYAASTFTDRDGNRCLVYWIREVSDPTAGWAGATSLPHLLHLDGDTLVAEPHPQLAAIRGPARRAGGGLPPQVVEPHVEIEWHPGVPGDISASVGPSELVATSPDGRALLTIRTANDEMLEIETSRIWELPHNGEARVLIDGPVCEIFTAKGVLAVPVEAAQKVQVDAIGMATATLHVLGSA